MSRLRPALAISAAVHAAALAALILLARALPPSPEPPKHFEIALTQPAAQLEPARPVAPPLETVRPVPPEPEKPAAATAAPPAPEPAVPVVAAARPLPARKPVVEPRPRPRPVVRRPEPVVRRAEPPPQLTDLPPPVSAPAPAPAPAAVPPGPAPSADLAGRYRALLGGWFERHKRYPNSARDHAEQGSAVVHFRVDPAGRIVTFGLTKSTGYADLDDGIAEMMRGAQLPAFPPGLTQPYLDVAVTLRFSLTQ